ncbi:MULTISPECIES: ankyrin repeat domain-containing protein [Pedobacter]|uniref:ankyrin repeat domain-containing protein n=1 Tax=Pedobacter TaxID=84567 RepID=UPI00210DAC33|nr:MULTISPECIES: ankyrin repeat domain-containing protein [unclassified Pedobacter]
MTNTSQVIIHAARQGNLDLLSELIRMATNVNARDERGLTPLINACYHNKYAAAKLLIDSGADVNVVDGAGQTILMGVALRGHADIAQLLIDSGAQLEHA